MYYNNTRALIAVVKTGVIGILWKVDTIRGRQVVVCVCDLFTFLS